MADPRKNACVIACQEELEAHGLHGEIEQRGKHLAVVWEQDGATRSFIVPATPSDWRAPLNSRSDLRRLLRAPGTSAEVIPFRPKLQVVEGDVVAHSRDIAEAFDKRHDHVLRDIDNLLKNMDSPELGNGLFRPVMTPDAQGIARRGYEMTRDGFALLAMGFTGAKAIRFKLSYIEAFNAMEGALRRSGEAMHSDVLARVDRLAGDVEALSDLLLEQRALPQPSGKGRYIRASVLRRMRRIAR